LVLVHFWVDITDDEEESKEVVRGDTEMGTTSEHVAQGGEHGGVLGGEVGGQEAEAAQDLAEVLLG
jgi:hypothetical protein